MVVFGLVSLLCFLKLSYLWEVDFDSGAVLHQYSYYQQGKADLDQ